MQHNPPQLRSARHSGALARYAPDDLHVATDLLDKRLVIVTGKGGVGKSTVALALGLAAARAGKRTIVCEVSSQEHSSQVFHRAEVGFHEVEMADNLWAISIDPDESMREYVLLQLKVKAMRDLLFRSRIFNYLAAATPGPASELVTIGKIWELALDDRKVKRGASYDLVIVDAPATGHGVGFLQTPRTFAGHRPRRPDARRRRRRSTRSSPTSGETGVAIVALPEEMPVNETVGARADADRGGRRRGRPRLHERALPGALRRRGGRAARGGGGARLCRRPGRAPPAARRVSERRRATTAARAARPARGADDGAGDDAAVPLRARARRRARSRASPRRSA